MFRFMQLFLLAFIMGSLGCRAVKQPASTTVFSPDINLWRMHFKSVPNGVRLNGLEPSLGSPAAQTTVVIFSNQSCLSCSEFIPSIQRVVETSKGTMRLLFKQFPLNKKCNPGLKKTLEPRDCHLAQQLSCAHNQGQFWPFLDLSLSKKIQTQAQLQSAFKQLKMSPVAFFSCISDSSQRQDVYDDARSGQQAGVMSLPAVYVFDNGTQTWWRTLKGEQSLRMLYQWRVAGMAQFPLP